MALIWKGLEILVIHGATILTVTFDFLGSWERSDLMSPMTPALLALYRYKGGVSRKL